MKNEHVEQGELKGNELEVKELEKAEAHLNKAEADLEAAEVAEEAAEQEIKEALQELKEAAGHHKEHHEHGNEKVNITIDDKPWTIHRGHHSVASLKTLAGIPLAYDLDRVVEGKFEPLPDDGGVTIKGGEIFISHVKDGSSS